MTITDYVRGINGSEERMGDFSSYQLDPHPIGVGGFSKVYRVSKGGHAYAMKIPMNANLSSDVTIQYVDLDARLGSTLLFHVAAGCPSQEHGGERH